jgi:hypothetical protein
MRSAGIPRQLPRQGGSGCAGNDSRPVISRLMLFPPHLLHLHIIDGLSYLKKIIEAFKMDLFN